MVVQSKQLRANAAKVHSGLRWDQVELKCCEECGKSPSPQELCLCGIWWLWSTVCAWVCIHQHTHRCVLQLGLCTGKERQRNIYSTSGLTVRVWVRYTVKSDGLEQCLLSQKWSYPHVGFPAEPSTEAEHVLWPGQHQLRSWLWHEHCRAQTPETTG